MERKPHWNRKYCPEIVEKFLAARAEGHSETGAAGKIGVSRFTIIDWGEKHEEFENARRLGEALCIDFWEGVLISQAKGEKKGGAAAAIFGLINRGKAEWKQRYRDADDEKEKDGQRTPANDADIAKKLAFLLDRGAAQKKKEKPPEQVAKEHDENAASGFARRSH